MQRESSGHISESECWELLGTVSLGRLAVCVAALPAILPVQYYVDGDELALCLGNHELPRRSVDDAVVAFAAEFIDPAHRAGWTVQVQGKVTLPRTVGVPTSCGQPAAGQIVHLAPVTLTGHRIHLCPFVSLQLDAR